MSDKPRLPDNYSFVALAIGLGLAFVAFEVIIRGIPNEYWPLHFVVAGVVCLNLFLGVPVLFEKWWWWRRAEETNGGESV